MRIKELQHVDNNDDKAIYDARYGERGHFS